MYKNGSMSPSSRSAIENQNFTDLHSAENELAVLQDCMERNEFMDMLPDNIVDMFFISDYKLVMENMLELHKAGKNIDLTILMDKLARDSRLPKERFTLVLADLTKIGMCNEEFFRQHLEVVAGYYQRRRYLEWGRSLIAYVTDMGNDRYLEFMERGIDVQNGMCSGSSVADIVAEVDEYVTGRKQEKKLYTKYRDIDKVTGGFTGGQLITIGARPSMGKSMFVASIVRKVAMQGKRVLVFDYENGNLRLGKRLLACSSGLSMSDIDRGKAYMNTCSVVQNGKKGTAYQWYRGAIEFVSTLDITIYDHNADTVDRIRAIAKRENRVRPLSLIVVDHIGLMEAMDKRKSSYEAVKEISRDLKKLAIELDIPVIIASQLNRSVEARQVKEPLMSDLRESGSIEQDSDVVALLYRPAYYNKTLEDNTLEINFAKVRDGAPTKITMIPTFYNMRLRDDSRQEIGQVQGLNKKQDKEMQDIFREGDKS